MRDTLLLAGYRGETVVATVAGEGKTVKPITDVAVDMLHKVGMTVDYQVMDFSAFVQRRASKKPPAEGGWSIVAGGFAAIDCARLPIQERRLETAFGRVRQPIGIGHGALA